MPATLRSIPSIYKFAVPKTHLSSKTANYSTLPRTNSRKKQEKLKFSQQTSTTPKEWSSSAIMMLKKQSISTKSSSSSSSSDKNATTANDRQLHDSFNGLLPRLFSLQYFFTEKGRLMFSDLFLNDIIVTESLFTGIKLYTDLQNPLLIKYGFNVHDFFAGSKEAFLSIQKAITVLHFMNNDLFMERKENYQLQEMNYNLLKTTLSQSLYELIEIKLQEKINPISDSDYFNYYSLKLNSLKLNSIIIEHVETELIEWSSPSAETELDSLIAAGTTGPQQQEQQQQEQQYPAGSVLARIDVQFESEQVYEHTENVKKPKVKRIISSNWRFEGCISGHVPLHWTILSMKNFIKNSSLER